MGAHEMMTADAVTIQSQPTMRLEYQQERTSLTHFLGQGVQGVQVIKVPPNGPGKWSPSKRFCVHSFFQKIGIVTEAMLRE